MPLYHALGNALVTQDEINAKAEKLARFETDGQPVRFTHGILSHDNPTPLPKTPSGDHTIPFDPIGIAKPLTIQLRHIYRGKHPQHGRDRSMLVTTTVKPVAQFRPDARAINFLIERIGTQKGFSHVPATSQGTPIVYYSPALTEREMNMTVEVGFNRFRGNAFSRFGTLLQSAAAIPAFIAHSTYLIGAGLVTKLATKIIEALVETPSSRLRHGEYHICHWWHREITGRFQDSLAGGLP